MKKQALIAKESKATAASITANSNSNDETFNVRIGIVSCLFNNIFLGFSSTFKCWRR